MYILKYYVKKTGRKWRWSFKMAKTLWNFNEITIFQFSENISPYVFKQKYVSVD